MELFIYFLIPMFINFLSLSNCHSLLNCSLLLSIVDHKCLFLRDVFTFFFLNPFSKLFFLNPDSVFALIDAIESSYREIFYQ